MKKIICTICSILLLSTGLYGCMGGETNASYGLETNESDVVIIDIGSTEVSVVNEHSKWYGESHLYTDGGIIAFSDTAITEDSSSVEVNDNIVTISAEGSYILTGSHENAQVVIDAGEDGNVQLLLSDVSLSNSESAVIYAKQSKNVIITAVDGTLNSLEDGENYIGEVDEEPSSVIFSNDDLIINGSGSLTIKGNYKDGIATDDDLLIDGSTLTVEAVNNGLKGKDSVEIYSGILAITAEDGIKSTNDEEEKGNIVITGGTIVISALEDGIQAEGDVSISEGLFNITTGDGSENVVIEEKTQGFGGRGMKPEGMNASGEAPRGEKPTGEKPTGNKPIGEKSTGDRPARNNAAGENAESTFQEAETVDTENANAILASGNIIVTGGSFVIDSEADAFNSDGDITVLDGEFTISSGDDGFHADGELIVENGTITISKSYEGLEGDYIAISGGTINLIASDDGINASGEVRGSAQLVISGGVVTVDANGDGIDANGTLSLLGGAVTVNGTTKKNNGVFDVDNVYEITGGTIAGFGSSGMILTPSSAAQGFVSVTLDEWVEGSEVVIVNASGIEIYRGTPTKTFEYLFMSSPLLVKGETVTISVATLADMNVIVE